MYIGSTDSRGLMHCLWEIIDNAVDEALAGHGERIDVALQGRLGGGEGPRSVKSWSTSSRRRSRAVSRPCSPSCTPTRFGGAYNASGGLHGVGASVVNALSARLDVEVDRGGVVWTTSLRRGVAGEFDGEGASAAFTPAKGLRKAGRPGRVSPAPGSATGRTGRSSPATRPSTTTSWSPGRGRRRSWCRGSSW